MGVSTINLVATGDVLPCRFVKENGRYTGAQASATTDVCCGISLQFLRSPNITGAWTVSATYAAVAGEPIPLFGAGETGLLEAGAAVSAGARLRPDSVGRGVTAAAGESSYAIAWESAAAAGNLIKVLCWPDNVGAA